MSLMESVKELREVTDGWQLALNELEQVMVARGFITKESLERARAEMRGEQ